MSDATATQPQRLARNSVVNSSGGGSGGGSSNSGVNRTRKSKGDVIRSTLGAYLKQRNYTVRILFLSNIQYQTH